MSFYQYRDRRVPRTTDLFSPPGTIGISDPKLIAWAFGIGGRRPTADPPRATRRGDLPDVNFSQAVIISRRSIWSRIAATFRAFSGRESPTEVQLELPLQFPSSTPVHTAGNVIPFRRAA